MALFIEQVLRWAILFFAGFSTLIFVHSYTRKQNKYMTGFQRTMRFAYLLGNTGIFLHAGLNLWNQFERTGKVFLWN